MRFKVLILCSIFFSAKAHGKTVYVYYDDGVSYEFFAQTVRTIQKNLPFYYEVRGLNAAEVIQNDWRKDAVGFVMPGGVDLPYTRKLNGVGNANIKDFVKNGGSYLGLCAGAYYASDEIEFDKGGSLEVLGTRELAFFPGKSIGPILAPYSYTTNSGARAAKIQLNLDFPKTASLFYNGGGFFENASIYSNVKIIGNYELNKRKYPAIIHVIYFDGNVVLSGVHFEFNPTDYITQDEFLLKILPELKILNIERELLNQKIFAMLWLK